ncbi:MAG: transglutaminase domain-containing protein [Saprospiraceae bacterium]
MQFPKLKLALVAFFLFFSIFQSNGQSIGWDLLRENQLLKAKKEFVNALLQNPQDEDALCGMLFISEVLQDHLNYKKYANQLIEATWGDEYFALFKHLYEGSPDQILAHDLDPSFNLKATLAKAEIQYENRRFEKSLATIQSVTQDFNWSVIGAFENVSGSGHIEQQPLEIESFKPNRIYKNEQGLEMKWVQRILRAPNGEINFNENLAYQRNGTYYANTFLTLPKDETIQLRIGRTTPMKIWMDDDLIFDQKDNLKYWRDGEIIELALKKGMHRILVKASTYVEEGSKSKLYLSFNDQYDEGEINVNIEESYHGDYLKSKTYRSRGNQIAKFALRVTDTNGNLVDNISSDFFGKNKTRKYQTKLIEKQWIKLLQNKIDKDSTDWKNYYLLTKMFLLKGLNEEGEEWFFPKMDTHKNDFYFKFLFAKILAANDKGEIAEAILSDINLTKTPLIASLINQLVKVDRRNDVANYHSRLKQILHFSPTHQDALMAYLNWLNEHGEEGGTKDFVRKFLADYPDSDYRDLFLKYLTVNKNQEIDYEGESKKQIEKNGIAAIEKMKFQFKEYDYLNAIAFYKEKKNDKKVLKLYDELIEIFPYRSYYLKEKAEFLIEQKRWDKAISLFEKVLVINPFHSQTMEKMGDIYLEKKQEKTALKYFKSAKEIDLATQKGNYVLNRLQKKIDKITGVESAKKYFQDFVTVQLQKDRSWEKKYQNAESLILMYNVQATLNEENRLNYHQKLWIKILNSAGVNYWTEADFSFLGEIGKVKVIKADGSEVTPSRNWNLVVFQNLQPGDLIEIEGFSNGDMTREIPNEMYHMAWLSMEIPIYKSVFEIVLPKGETLNYVCNKVNCDPEIREENKVKIYTWENNETPKNEHEEAVLDKMDKFSWLMLSTQSDWKKVVEWYERKTYRRLEANYEVKNQLTQITNDSMSDEEKVRAIYNYLTTGITYSHVSFLNSNYVPKKPSKTICGGIGDCKDVASLMISMLRELDIEAYYTLVRTSNFTQQESRPSVLAFDHVVVGYRLEGKEMRYADLTTDYFSNNVLPRFDNDQWALLIKPNESELFRLPNDQLNAFKNFVKIKTIARIVDERNLELQVKMENKGVIAGEWRETLNNKTTQNDHLLFLKENLASAEFDHLKIRDFSFDHLQEIDSNLMTSIELKAFHHLEKVSNFQILQIPILHPITTRTALFGEVRHNNLALGELFNLAPSEQVVDLQIPNGFELLEIPNDIILENEFGRYELIFKKQKTGIQISRKLVFKQHFVSSDAYADFKIFYLELLDGDRTKLAIRKRANLVRQ